jgi:hypothetical protein
MISIAAAQTTSISGTRKTVKIDFGARLISSPERLLKVTTSLVSES